MQKRKSFLMKIFVLLTVVFCTFALAFGMVGCAAEPVTIKSAALNANGEIVLTYTDGNTITVAGSVKGETGATGAPGADAGTLKDGCAHDFASHVVRYANCAQEGISVEVCTKCNGYKTVATPKNPAVHGTYTTVIDANNFVKVELTSYETPAGPDNKPATCFEDGYSHTVCEKCGETMTDAVLPKLDHKHPNGSDAYKLVTGAKENGNICMDGSYTAYVCELCFDVDEEGTHGAKPTYTPAGEHHTADETWALAAMPTETSEGKITGICTLCDEEAEIVLPVLSDATAYDKNIPTCVQAATATTELKKVYTLNAAWVAKYGWEGEFKFDYIITHRIVDAAGEDRFFEEGQSYVYATIADLFDAGQITWSEGKQADCENERSAIVHDCADCGHDVVIKSFGTHVWENIVDEEGKLIVVAPTCTEKGYYEKECKVCGIKEKVENANATDHTYVKEGDAIPGANNTVTITAKCKDCGDVITVTGIKNDALSSDATCTAASKTVYDYTLNNQPAQITINGEGPVDHKSALGLEIKEGELYSYEAIEAYLADVTWSAGNPGDCSTEKYAYITCTMCTEDIVFAAQGPHNLQNVVDEEGKTIHHDATCVEKGYYEKKCTACDEIVKIYDQEALDHSYKLEGEPVAIAGGKVKLTAKCERCGNTITIEGVKNAAESKAATCVEVSKTVYDYVLNSVPAKLTIEGDETVEHITAAGLKIWEGEEKEYDDIVNYISEITWSEGKAGDCSTSRYAYIHCETCNKDVVFKSKGTHNWVDVKDEAGTVIVHLPTCTEAGYYEKKCSACGEVKKVETADALDHYWKKVGEEPAEAGKLTIHVECERCQITDTVVGTKNEALSTAATCTAPAKVVYDYTLNGVPATIAVIEGEPLAHQYYDKTLTWDVEVVRASGTVVYTCTGKICKVCGALLVQTMELKNN